MDFVQLVFLESPSRLAVFCFLLLAAVLLLRRRWTGTLRRYTLPVVLACILLLFVIQSAVVTQRERILIACDDFVEAISREDSAALAAAIGRRYDCDNMDRAAILEYLNSSLESLDVFDTRFRRRDITVTGQRADMLLVALATVRTKQGAGEFHTGRWRLGWALEDDKWKIVSIRPEMIDTAPVNSLRALKSYVP